MYLWSLVYVGEGDVGLGSSREKQRADKQALVEDSHQIKFVIAVMLVKFYTFCWGPVMERRINPPFLEPCVEIIHNITKN